MTPQETKNVPISSTVAYDYEDKRKKKNHGLPEKIFAQRESVLTFLFENPHVRTIHHLAIVLFLGMCSVTFLRRYLESNDVTSGFRLISAGFAGFHISILLWLFIYLLVCCVYFSFLTWAKLRVVFPPKSTPRKICDISTGMLLLGYYVFGFVFATRIVTFFHLPSGSAAIILVEQTRLLMKVHAFVRSNAPKVLQFKEKSDQILVLPTFQHFVFFTWIPTLVYRDTYPRTATINWKKVAEYASEILAVVLFYAFFMERFSIPLYQDFGRRSFSRSELCLVYLEAVFPGILLLVVTFYLILHLVQNLFAELLRFGDRMFYKDWWTATDFPTYYRKWNVVVHDWLYAYVYKDCYETLFPGCKNVAKYVTFLLSSVVHEYILSNVFGYFMPIMFVQFFGLGTLVTYIKVPQNALFNMLFWLSLALGSGLIMTAYGLEFYARYNEVPSTAGSFDFFIPRMLTCDYCYSD